MEIKEILNIFIKYKKQISLATIIGIFIGITYYYIPKKYITTGDLYITRKIENQSNEFFNYEGYYSQQAALTYTNTTAALLESTDILKTSLEELNIDINEKTLKAYKRNIKVEKAGPQVITLKTKDFTYENSLKMWEILTKNLIQKTENINAQKGDENLSINKISETPITSYTYQNIWIDSILGGLMGCFIYTFLITILNYKQKDQK